MAARHGHHGGGITRSSLSSPLTLSPSTLALAPTPVATPSPHPSNGIIISSSPSSSSPSMVSTTTTSVAPVAQSYKTAVITHPYYITGPYRMYQCSPIPVAIASVGYVAALMLMGVSNAIANIRRPLDGEPLRDLAFEYLPHFHTNDLANNLVYGGITFTSWVVILHPRRRHLCRRLLTMWALIYLMRATTISVTSLPDPNDMCRSSTLENGVNTFLAGLSCGDMIFSGHTVALILNPLILHQAFPYMPRWVAFFMWFYMILGMWALLATHMHYLVDILVAVYISLVVYWAYQATATNEKWLAKYEWLAWWEHDRYYYCSWQQMVTWIHWRLFGEAGSIDPRVGEDPTFDYLVPLHAIHRSTATTPSAAAGEAVVGATVTAATSTTEVTPKATSTPKMMMNGKSKQQQQRDDDDVTPPPPSSSNDEIDDTGDHDHHDGGMDAALLNGMTNGLLLRPKPNKSH